ncbi:MAG: penicillin-binding protein 1B [Pseudohongiella sp.]|nr:penicillin-binding protein 1B [Pseudohongiella sp.]MDP2128773.1 penicillin-binding protein 1B [Pseudohongiella sp.]
MTKRRVSRKKQQTKRFLPRLLLKLFLAATVAVAIWCVFIDIKIRRDFEALQWSLPARIYARPVELYAGAQLNIADLSDTLQRLGYRRSSNISGPGEYSAGDSRVRLWTRGFDFWDGEEPSIYVDVTFLGRRIDSLRGNQNTGELALVRLEPVEIAQINPDTGEDRLPLTLNDVPPDLLNAVVAVEDHRFYSHFGIDPIGIMRAFVTNLRAGGIVQGGSTLTQQLVKNLYLTQDRTFRRKVEEALMALSLEIHFSKDEILAAYMNEVFLGQEGSRAIHGFALAAEHYFGRPLMELPLEDLALLAGLPRGASYYHPRRNPQRAVERRNVVLSQMVNQGYITQAQFDQARARPLQVAERPAQRGSGYPAFMELVRADLARDYDADALQTEGLRIFTTLDLRVQNTMETALNDAVAAVEVPASPGSPAGDALEAAMVITDASTGEVRALAGSRRSGYTGFNRAMRASRPIGSLVKPAVMLTALETGRYTLASVLKDEPVTIPLNNRDTWTPRNYDNQMYGDVYLFDALQRSMNLATVDLGMEIGVPNVINTLRKLGFDGPVQPYPSVLLGSVNMTPLQVAGMYQTLASNGFRSPLRAVEAVTTGSGERLARYGIGSEQVADPTSMFQLEWAMQGVFERGTARAMLNRLDRRLPLAGKTGTTNDLRDSWFAGYGGDLVGVVWLGHDDNRETGLTGSSGALRVWTDIMNRVEIQPRQNIAPADVSWQRVSAQATRNESARDCRSPLMLPLREGQSAAPSVNCESGDSVIERIFDRLRNL